MKTKLNKRAHIKFFKRILEGCPASFAEHDCYRVLMAFFCVSGLDVLDALDTLTPQFKQDVIDWVYHLQVVPILGEAVPGRIAGFQGMTTMKVEDCCHEYETSHLTMTYSALCCLLILGDDLSRVDRAAVLHGLNQLQLPDGSWSGSYGGEADMRFVFSAACVAYLLDDTSTIDLDAMVEYIVRSIGYDGGVAQQPGLESHGGSTYCAVAALVLTGRINALSQTQLERLKRWCIMRQQEGFQGRPHKPEDTCYSFWVGGALALLEGGGWVHPASNRRYVMSTQDHIIGGFAKWPDSRSDPLHAFLGLAGLSLNGEEGIAAIMPFMPITQRAHTRLKQLHEPTIIS